MKISKFEIGFTAFLGILLLTFSIPIAMDVSEYRRIRLESRIFPARITYIERANNEHRSLHVGQNRFNAAIHVKTELELASYTHWQCVAVRCNDFDCIIVRSLPDSVCRAIEGGR